MNCQAIDLLEMLLLRKEEATGLPSVVFAPETVLLCV